jgi:cold shock CspA family protein
MQGTIRYVSNKGWYFAESDADHSSVFVHQRDVLNDQYLHVDDRIEFALAENPKHPGKTCGVGVKYLGHPVRQVSAESPRHDR